VFVPDGPLRTIPFAALHDGQDFLVRRYAVATTPGLGLIGTDIPTAQRRTVMANGITRSVRGFPALPYVGNELSSIADVLPATIYADENFLVSTIDDKMLAGEYSVLHIATHGQIQADYRQSFLLAYDDLITMDRLDATVGIGRFSDQPLDLLVLSACETAAGDDRAALGFAGIAVKAGARSALATLWLINDQSTATLVANFYRQLVDEERTKAVALRHAQISLLDDERYAHPNYWAPFVLIGDWR
jgi:CHAT domain-containing protein